MNVSCRSAVVALVTTTNSAQRRREQSKQDGAQVTCGDLLMGEPKGRADAIRHSGGALGHRRRPRPRRGGPDGAHPRRRDSDRPVRDGVQLDVNLS